jgi:(1->4)-alpha-D-glucan 1-alpha-D-glucosylmutase
MILPPTLSHPESPPITGSDIALSRDTFVGDAAVDALLQHVIGCVQRRRLPVATYRLQFNRGFTFQDATAIVSYLHALGISHVYASPYWKARTGSRHGYDLVDHASLNPEVGNVSDFDDFVAKLRHFGMGQIVDVVPNHMCVAAAENAWWYDVLENGPSSQFASYFDIDWHPLKPDLHNKVLLPVLGDQFGRVLEDQGLNLRFADGAFTLHYFDHRFPIAVKTWSSILRHRFSDLSAAMGADSLHVLEFESILTAIDRLPANPEVGASTQVEQVREQDAIKHRLARLCRECPKIADFVAETVAIFNGVKGDPASFDLLDQLLLQQFYRLSSWQVAADEINYRRFFDVNELAAVCMERPDVFDASHALLLRLLTESKIDGVRVDHADGLYDPTGYVQKLQESAFIHLCHSEYSRDRTDVEWAQLMPVLRQRFEELRAAEPSAPAANPLYVIVEKILEPNETLPQEWPVNGTTGYEFLNDVNGVFVDSQHAQAFTTVYRRFTQEATTFGELVYRAKKLVMLVSMSSELNALGHQLDRLSEQRRESRDFTLNGLTRALRECIACFPVYRTYISETDVSARDRQNIDSAVARAKRYNPTISGDIFDFIRELLLLQPGDAGRVDSIARQRFVRRLQQFTGPLMAKAVEDTAFYVYNRLVSLNEVGGWPEDFGISVDTFHRRNVARRARHPHGLLATSTHDTKRGEDVRARINVLSEIPEMWRACIVRWARWNKRYKRKIEGLLAPSPNDEYLIYQTLIGTWPFETPHGVDLQHYLDRIQKYMVKAVREAKVASSWISPHEEYEQAMSEFIQSLLNDDPMSAFRTDFEPLVRSWAAAGVWNSLSQTLLKIASPGVPDLYQGTELWDLRLVDPDNRQAVDFESRRRMLGDLLDRMSLPASGRHELLRALLAHYGDGRIKLFVTRVALQARRADADLFATGEYFPLAATGRYADHVCAFARVCGDRSAIVIVPRLTLRMVSAAGEPPIGATVWDNTHVPVPDTFQEASWRELFSQQTIPVHDGGVSVGEALERFPVALLMGRLPA